FTTLSSTFFFFMLPRPPISTLFPYTTLFRSHITNYYFSTVITGIQDLAFKEGFKIILFVTNDSPERELEIIESIAITSLDGLLVSISSNTDECSHFQELINERMPIVLLYRVLDVIEASKLLQTDTLV